MLYCLYGCFSLFTEDSESDNASVNFRKGKKGKGYAA